MFLMTSYANRESTKYGLLEYIVEQSNTNSEDQQDTDKSIDESIVDVKSDNKEEKLYDEPELVYKEDKQEEKAEVNQYEHYY